jgi:hypothetical protein
MEFCCPPKSIAQQIVEGAMRASEEITMHGGTLQINTRIGTAPVHEFGIYSRELDIRQGTGCI